MAYQNSTVSFEKMLMKFISDEDPMQSMLKWLCERLMEAEVENKLCAEKSERNHERQGYRSGYRVRRFDTRMGTIVFCQVKIPEMSVRIPSFCTGNFPVLSGMGRADQEAATFCRINACSIR